MRQRKTPQEYKERNRRIYEERKAGLKLHEIAERYGINKERVRQICLKEERLERRRRYNRRGGTLSNIDDLNYMKDKIERFAKLRARLINEADQDLIQKIDNLIEIYSE